MLFAAPQRSALTAQVALAFTLSARLFAAVDGSPLFSTNFNDGLSSEWKTIGGTWGTNEGLLGEADGVAADPKKALVVVADAQRVASEVIVTAKLRVDGGWKADSRAGISVCCDPSSGRGLNLVFRAGELRWMQDFVTWGPGIEFHWEPGTWYWMKLYKKTGDSPGRSWIDEGREPSLLKGKVWRDGDAEPSEWMIRWTGFSDSNAGYPGLTADSMGAAVSFGALTIEKALVSLPVKMDGTTIGLNGIWQVHPEPMNCIGDAGLATVRAESDGWLPSEVPGEIHLDLMKAGRMPDPSVGLDTARCRWPETMSWWYRTTFEVDADFSEHERRSLVFDGLDLHAQVFLNGRLVGESADAFVPATFDAGPFLIAGRNELVVRLTAGSELSRDPSAAGGEKIPNPTSRGWDGRRWLRKPQFSYGWDWVDSLPNIGIWRGVRLEGRRHAVLHDLRLDTLRDGNTVSVQLDASIENLDRRGGRACVFELAIAPPDGGAPITRTYPLDLPPGLVPMRDDIEIPDAKLWWPNGMGHQPLYRVTAKVTNGCGATFDQRTFAIGLRTIELDRSRMAEGSRFCFRVNGQDVFCRGGNIGPQDAILARVTDTKYERLIAEAKNANMNMLRINGCSIYEAPAFYDACDRAGILIYHDFMLTDTTYPEDDAPFVAAVRAETESIVRMLRHHPSIALWSGNNENTWLFSGAKGYGEKLYNQVLPEICMWLDPERPYWPGSPSGGSDPNSERIGDCHWWGKGYAGGDRDQRIRPDVYDSCRARFVSEYGVIGPCHLDSIRQYLAADEMSIDHPAFRMHVNDFEKSLGDPLLAGIRYHYANPEEMSVADYSTYGQMFQAIMHGSAIEAMRFRKQDKKDDCEGVLMWSYSDCWGETGWSVLDYYLRRKASYYWTRRAYAPVKVIVRRRGDEFVTRVVNDTLAPAAGTVEFGSWRLDGSARESKSIPFDVAANSMLEIATVKATHDDDSRHWLYGAVLRGSDGVAFDQSILLSAPCRGLDLSKPVIKLEKVEGGVLEISCPVYAHAVHVEDHGHELWSDNWFDLLPGVPLRIQVASGHEADRFLPEGVTPNQK